LCRTCSNRRISADKNVQDKIAKTKSKKSYSKIFKKLWEDSEYRKKVERSAKEFGNSAEEKHNRSVRAYELWRDDSYRDKVTKSCIENYVQPNYTKEVRNKLSESTKNNWKINNIADKYKIGLAKCAEWSRSDDNKAILQSIIAFNRTPEGRRILSERATRNIKNGKLKSYGKRSTVKSKKGGVITVRSSYEAKYVEILDNDDSVTSFLYEPFFIEYEFDGIIRRYTPDFLVYENNRLFLVEVKPKRMLEIPINIAKIDAATQLDIDFEIVTEEELF